MGFEKPGVQSVRRENQEGEVLLGRDFSSLGENIYTEGVEDFQKGARSVATSDDRASMTTRASEVQIKIKVCKGW